MAEYNKKFYDRATYQRMWDFYDVIIVAFSGGKDSLACLLYLLEAGCPREKIELWHHDIDGHGDDFFDWEITPSYCKAIAEAFEIPIYFSWKVNGIKGEMLRDKSNTQPTAFEVPDGMGGKKICYSGGKEIEKYKTTRRQFPAPVMNLNIRWCTGTGKIDVGAAAINGQKRFKGRKVIFITGERAQESGSMVLGTGRAGYAERELHATDPGAKFQSKIKTAKKNLAKAEWLYANPPKSKKSKVQVPTKEEIEQLRLETEKNIKKIKSAALKATQRRERKALKFGQNGMFRTVHAWRPIHKWSTEHVWEIIEKYKVNAHPCYHLGWGRCSCACCIFGNADQWASLQRVAPDKVAEVAKYEKEFGKTINMEGKPIMDIVNKGIPYAPTIDPKFIEMIMVARSKNYNLPILLDAWIKPYGATSDLDGPC